jgi:hypothetical protein
MNWRNAVVKGNDFLPRLRTKALQVMSKRKNLCIVATREKAKEVDEPNGIAPQREMVTNDISR